MPFWRSWLIMWQTTAGTRYVQVSTLSALCAESLMITDESHAPKFLGSVDSPWIAGLHILSAESYKC
jgi:hypothetical protein